jgi:hypothetical protein
MKDGRRILGWPAEWPNFPQQGHFVLKQAKWLIDKDNSSSTIPLETADRIMIDAANVEMVTFLKFNDELEGEQHEC